jgi:hypothetical protein
MHFAKRTNDSRMFTSNSELTDKESHDHESVSDYGSILEEEGTDSVDLKFEIVNIVFMTIAVLIFVCGIFLIRQETFVGILNGFFLIASGIAIAVFEIYQPPYIIEMAPLWNHGLHRGVLLIWLSAIGMEGFWILGFISFCISLVVFIGLFALGFPTLTPVYLEEQIPHIPSPIRTQIFGTNMKKKINSLEKLSKH